MPIRFHTHITVLVVMVACSIARMAPATSTHDIESYYSVQRGLLLEFTQESYITALQRTMTTSGTLALQTPGKIRIDFIDPIAKSIISDGTRLWSIFTDDSQYSEQTLTPASKEQFALHLLDNFSHIDRHFSVVHSDRHTLQLTPKTSNPFYQQLVCTFNAKGQLQSMNIHTTQNTISTYRFKHLKENTNFPSSHFTFAPRKGLKKIK